MDKREKDIVGVYHSEQEAILAVEDLKRQGYNAEEISVIGKNRDEVNVVNEETGTKTGEGAATGAITGGALGGLTGLLAGVGALAIPGIGPIVAAGPIVATLTGATAGAGVGGLSGAFIGMGISEDKAKYYDNSVKEGKILVLVDKKENFATTNEQSIPSEVDMTAVEGTRRTENNYNTLEDRDPASLRKEEEKPRIRF
ncbi:general stress protein [Metabacillus herbersteinensis]|uniref:General stress protein n=1 Tax=Metabacillus herbersteinensis TaxID=283816 RepID=A0ABV6GFV1_9BACI